MKNPFCRRRRGTAFTLVELLVVMGIIAILAGVLVVSVGAAMRFAKKTKSGAIAASLQTAVQSYYTEYGVYPMQAGYPGSGDAYYDGTTTSRGAWTQLIWALCGNVNPATGVAQTGVAVTNARGIPFLSPSKSDLDATYGIPLNPFGVSGSSGSLYFYMGIDTDYSGIVGDNGDANGKLPNFSSSTNTLANTPQPVAAGVAVWCPNDQPTSGSKPSPTSAWTHTY